MFSSSSSFVVLALLFFTGCGFNVGLIDQVPILFKVDCQSLRSSVPHSVRQSMVRNPIFALQEVFQTSQHLRILISKSAMPNGHSYNVFPSFQSGCVELVSLDTFPVGLLYLSAGMVRNISFRFIWQVPGR